MPEIELEEITITEVAISTHLKEQLLTVVEEEKQVIVHCKIEAIDGFNAARIWPTTYLIDVRSNHRSTLLHVDGVTMYPVWTEIPSGKTLYFTLIFSGLPASSLMFDFMEDIPEPGGFFVSNIKRNPKDIYSIELT